MFSKITYSARVANQSTKISLHVVSNLVKDKVQVAKITQRLNTLSLKMYMIFLFVILWLKSESIQ